MEKTTVIIEGLLTVLWIISYYVVSRKGRASNVDKSAIAVLSILILGLQDRFKLLFWSLTIGIIFIIKSIIKKKSKANG